MCNLYSMTRSQDEVRRVFRIHDDRVGNLRSLSSIFPKDEALITHKSMAKTNGIKTPPSQRQLRQR